LSGKLEGIVKIRSVQQFNPSQALSFIFMLKKALRMELADQEANIRYQEELRLLETTIDQVALLLFDSYMAYREKIYEIKANELKMRSLKLLERINMAQGVETTADDLKPDKLSGENDAMKTIGSGQRKGESKR